jgi:soluble lytic murein transglycosylase-like protein
VCMSTYRRQKRPITLRKWLKRNVVNIVLFAVVTVGLACSICAISNHALSDNNELIAAAPVDTGTPTSFQTNAPPPTVEPIVEEVFYFDVPLSTDLQDYIREMCEEKEVPMELVIAMIDVESTFTADVISRTNDYGLMQINICNHETLTDNLSITDFLDPYQNVKCGIYIIAGHLQKTDGDIVLALMRYNCGATGAKKLWDKGIYSTDYTDKIMTAYNSYIKESRPTE